MSEFLVLGEMNDWANVGASLKYPALAEILWPPAKKYESPSFAEYVRKSDLSELPLDVTTFPLES